MHFFSKDFKKTLHYGIKTVLGLFIFISLFSPVVALADNQENCEARGGSWRTTTAGLVTGEHSCYAFNGSILPEGEHNTFLGKEIDANQGSIDSTLATWISNIVYVFTVGIGSIVAYVAAYFFNFAIFISLNSTAYAMGFVSQGWSMVRDIANMSFIFILIYIAVTITINADTSKTMQTLVRVIAIALIINFSFFFARVVIDGGNILAIQFYNGIQAPQVSQGTIINSTNATTQAATGLLFDASKHAKDLTASIMGGIHVQNILNTESFKQFSKANSDSLGGFFSQLIALSFIYICVGIIFGLLAAMFFTIGLKFISRIVVLWIVIIAAPLALVLKAIGGSAADGYFKQWLNALITYSLYPAIFLFLFIIITNFAYGLAGCEIGQATPCTGSITGAIFNDINNGSDQSGITYLASIAANVGIRLGFIMVLLYLALQASSVVSKWGGTLAQTVTATPDKWAASLSGFSRRITASPARLATTAGRQTAGFGWRYTGGLAAAKTSGLLKRSTWANTPGTLGGVIGYTAQKSVLEPVAGSAIPGTSSYKARRDYLNKRQGEMKANLRFGEDKDTAETIGKTIEANTGSGEKPEKDIDSKALDRIQNMNETQMKELNATQIKTLSKVFTENQMKVVEKLEKMSEQDKEIARKNFDANSPHSPLRKVQKQIEILRDISKKLGNIGAIDSKIGSGVKIDQTVVKDIKEALNKQMEQADKKYEDARISRDSDAMAKAGSERRLIREGLDASKELDTKIKDVRPGVGGYDKPGEFNAPK